MDKLTNKYVHVLYINNHKSDDNRARNSYLSEALIAPATPGHPHRVCPRVGILQRLPLLFAEDELRAGGRVQRLHARRFPSDPASLLMFELSLLEHLVSRLKQKYETQYKYKLSKYGSVHMCQNFHATRHVKYQTELTHLLSLLVGVGGFGVQRRVPLLRHTLPAWLVSRERRVVAVVDERREALPRRVVDVPASSGTVERGC